MPHDSAALAIAPAPDFKALRGVDFCAARVGLELPSVAPVPGLAAGLGSRVRALEPIVRGHGGGIVRALWVGIEPVSRERARAIGRPGAVVTVRRHIEHGRNVPAGQVGAHGAQALITPGQGLGNVARVQPAGFELVCQQAALGVFRAGDGCQRFGVARLGNAGNLEGLFGGHFEITTARRLHGSKRQESAMPSISAQASEHMTRLRLFGISHATKPKMSCQS